MNSVFLLDVVVWNCSGIVKLLSSENKSLLISGNSFFVKNLFFEGENGVWVLNFHGDTFSCEGLDEDLLSTSKSKYKVNGGFFVDVVVRESSRVLKSFSGEDQSLLCWGDTLLVLDFSLDVFNWVRGLSFKSDSFSSKSSAEDLEPTSESKNEMNGWFFLDIIVSKCSSVLKSLSGEDKSLFGWGDTLFVLDLFFDGLDGVGLLDTESHCFSSECSTEDLHIVVVFISDYCFQLAIK